MTRTFFIALLATTILFSCKNENKQNNVESRKEDAATSTPNPTMAASKETVVVRLESKSGSTATGLAIFVEEYGQVRLVSEFEGLTPGIHAMHLHEKSDCSAADGTSTGGHWNPTFEKHGSWGDPKGYHRGDIGNLMAKADGTAKLMFETDQWCIGCGDETRDILGKAVIIHDGRDDLTTQPTGNAGGRVSCGGIIK
ncbi:MAG TPA: superoxide dismutase [Flavobacteriaceae bacterium]|nr:superoxide dismutase [Flavobacteriaceae bacterium]